VILLSFHQIGIDQIGIAGDVRVRHGELGTSHPLAGDSREGSLRTCHGVFSSDFALARQDALVNASFPSINDTRTAENRYGACQARPNALSNPSQARNTNASCRHASNKLGCLSKSAKEGTTRSSFSCWTFRTCKVLLSIIASKVDAM
jgi:hypothetical protein